jgi:hypothetical protein
MSVIDWIGRRLLINVAVRDVYGSSWSSPRPIHLHPSPLSVTKQIVTIAADLDVTWLLIWMWRGCWRGMLSWRADVKLFYHVDFYLLHGLMGSF